MKSFMRGGYFFLAAAIMVISAAVWYICCDGGPDAPSNRGHELRSRRLADVGKKSPVRKVLGRDKGRRVRNSSKTVVRVKPNISLEVDDEAKLTGEMKAIYAALQQALDAENSKKVFALVQKLQSMDEWPDDIPRSVKLKALDALAWFGASGLSEAVGFLADADPTVIETAIEKYDEMLSDCNGDTELSKALTGLVKVVHDADALDTFLMSMNEMRPTVRAETALSILSNGTPEAISVMNENIEFIFSDADVDYEIKTRADIEQYLKDAEQTYKDDPEKRLDDEEFYGPTKD